MDNKTIPSSLIMILFCYTLASKSVRKIKNHFIITTETINYCCCFINLSNILLMIDQSF